MWFFLSLLFMLKNGIRILTLPANCVSSLTRCCSGMQRTGSSCEVGNPASTKNYYRLSATPSAGRLLYQKQKPVSFNTLRSLYFITSRITALRRQGLVLRSSFSVDEFPEVADSGIDWRVGSKAVATARNPPGSDAYHYPVVVHWTATVTLQKRHSHNLYLY